jgi:F-type H+-transporting ATPase subunit delta
MRGASADSLSSLTESLGSGGGAGGDHVGVADDLFAVAAVLRSEPSLRRVVTDVSVPAKAKSDLVRQLFAKQVRAASLDLLTQAVGLRWSATRDLGDALEQVAVVAVVKDAEQAGRADALEDELFEFGLVVEDHPDLRDALSDRTRSADDKSALVHRLLDGKATDHAIRLVEQALSGSYRTFALALEAYRRIASEHRNRLVAVVRAADGLDDKELQRLESALSGQYGRPVHANVRLDPDVVGGVKVEIGDDVIDGTVATRLGEAQRRLAG